jgi:ribonuclease BN (tRNA processing enzyme)
MQDKAAPQTQIVLLGTGTPLPDPERSGPCTAIVVKGTPYLVDFGVGVVRRAAAARNKGVKALEPTNLKIGFITHLHSDHTLGFADVILTPWIMGRREPLDVYGPLGTTAMADHLLKAYQTDIKTRTEGLEHSNTTGYKVNVHEIEAGLVYKDANVKVTAFPVSHGLLRHLGIVSKHRIEQLSSLAILFLRLLFSKTATAATCSFMRCIHKPLSTWSPPSGSDTDKPITPHRSNWLRLLPKPNPAY